MGRPLQKVGNRDLRCSPAFGLGTGGRFAGFLHDARLAGEILPFGVACVRGRRSSVVWVCPDWVRDLFARPLLLEVSCEMVALLRNSPERQAGTGRDQPHHHLRVLMESALLEALNESVKLGRWVAKHA